MQTTAIKSLTAIKEATLEESADLSKYCTMRLQSRGNLVKVFSIEALQEVLSAFSEQKISYQIIGRGSNQLFAPQYSGAYLKLELPFDKSYLDEFRESYTIPASVSLSALTTHAIRFNVEGWQVFTGNPATLGGAIYMNAGTSLGEIGPLVRKVKIVTGEGKIREETVGKKIFWLPEKLFFKKRGSNR